MDINTDSNYSRETETWTSGKGGEELGGVEGRKTVIVVCMRKNQLLIKEKIKYKHRLEMKNKTKLNTQQTNNQRNKNGMQPCGFLG